MGSEDYINWFFQYVFAGTTATIVSGAVAERCRFRAYLIYSFFLSGFVYPVACHWIWDPSGFLYGKVADFSGSGAVHLVGGAAAMSGAWVLGPRIGRFVVNKETGKKEPRTILGHNAVLAACGTLLLWFGFFPFNAGRSSRCEAAGEICFPDLFCRPHFLGSFPSMPRRCWICHCRRAFGHSNRSSSRRHVFGRILGCHFAFGLCRDSIENMGSRLCHEWPFGRVSCLMLRSQRV
jgi:Ammonium Transporter Family